MVTPNKNDIEVIDQESQQFIEEFERSLSGLELDQGSIIKGKIVPRVEPNTPILIHKLLFNIIIYIFINLIYYYLKLLLLYYYYYYECYETYYMQRNSLWCS